MKWLKILQIERDAPCRHYEIAIGLYSEPPHIHGTDPEDTEEPEVFHMVISDSQIRALLGFSKEVHHR